MGKILQPLLSAGKIYNTTRQQTTPQEYYGLTSILQFRALTLHVRGIVHSLLNNSHELMFRPSLFLETALLAFARVWPLSQQNTHMFLPTYAFVYLDHD